MPTSNAWVRCLSEAVNYCVSNDPHLETLANIYKQADPLTLANGDLAWQPLVGADCPRTCSCQRTAKLSYLGVLQQKPDIFPKCDRAKYLLLVRPSQNQYSLQNLLCLSEIARENPTRPN